GNDQSAASESFEDSLLEAPQYTRPADFEGHGVPEVLRSGDHERIRRWRLAQSLHRTLQARPDLITQRGGLSDAEERLLEEFPAVPYPESSL
ncbi:MAG: tRNA (guanosine(37)-N1)-methyltransferase TrmD, partial [Actinomycetota bacterium]